MNKVRGIIGGGIAGAVVIGIIAALAYNVSEENESQAQIPVQDEPIGLSDSVEVNKTGTEFFEDAEGKKTYVINVGDAPDFGEE